ncbi:MAG TPA: lysylphosphatidylglycerol synthase transmembrane domain-containing protein, partial [Lacipirellulaceae bacterium]|nr:lysylphosphatidylglycerol synthase transmembrane domain-containing protein [Lacipirellulaceae bacterium]
MAIAKVGLAVGILTYLIIQARHGFARLSARSLSWPFLAAALLCSLATATLSFTRWHVLIRALNISSRLVDSLRLGALGFALNFVSLGSIGGDLFKAVFLAHGHPGQRTEAVATVFADRALGLLAMLSIASCGILVTGLTHVASPPLRALAQFILLVTLLGWVAFALLMFVGALSGNWITEKAARVPVIGKTAARLLGTVHIYRTRKSMLLVAFIMSAMMALCSITTFYLISRGLGIQGPPWSEHVVIVPMAGVVGAVPLTPSGLGTMEYAVEELYKAMPGGADVVK